MREKINGIRVEVANEQNKTQYRFLYFFIAICFSVMTVIFSAGQKWDEYLLIILSGVFSLFFSTFWLTIWRWLDLYKRVSHIIKGIAIILSFFSLEIVYNRYYQSTFNFLYNFFHLNTDTTNILAIVMLCIGIVPIFVYYVIIFDIIDRYIVDAIFRKLDDFEKAVLFPFLIILFISSIYLHISNSAFDFTQYIEDDSIMQVTADAIMNCDSFNIQLGILQFSYDFRHPFFTLVVLPEYTIAYTLGKFFFPSAQWTMALFSVCNIVKLGVVGIIIHRLSKSKMATVLYYCSFPTILYSIVIERHVWMAFWNVIFIWILFQEEWSERDIYYPVILAGGANLIGVSLAPAVLKDKRILNAIKIGLMLAGAFFSTLIICGDLYRILHIYEDICININASVGTSFLSKVLKYMYAIKSCFGFVKIRYNGMYTYYDEAGISILGGILLFMTISAAIVLWKKRDKFACTCMYWIMVSFVLFPVVGFSNDDFSMHMILFSWAFISLICMAYECVLDRLKHCKFTVLLQLARVLFVMIVLVSNLITINRLIVFSKNYNNILDVIPYWLG